MKGNRHGRVIIQRGMNLGRALEMSGRRGPVAIPVRPLTVVVAPGGLLA